MTIHIHSFRLILLLFAGYLSSGSVSLLKAQESEREPSLSLIGQYYEGQIELRWAPSDPQVWLEAMQKGYRLERARINNLSLETPVFELMAERILPFERNYFEARVEDEDADYIMVVGECVYGDWRQAASENLGGWIAASDQVYNKFGFHLFASDLDFEAAQAGGLGFVDKTAEPETAYFYRLSIVGLENTSTVVRVKAENSQRAVPKIFQAVEGEGQVRLDWLKADHKSHFSAYFVQRSANGQSWSDLNELPYTQGESSDSAFVSAHFSYTDDVVNYQPYSYRLIGVDAFGRRSRPSESVQAMGRDRTPPALPETFTAEWIGGDDIELSWQLEVSESDLTGFYIVRAIDYGGGFELISGDDDFLPIETRSFTDEAANPFGINYYVLGLVDTAGNVAATQPVTGFIIDEVAPESPLDLSAEVDSFGHITLSWSASEATDLKGYYVYFANSEEDVFTNISNKPFQENQFLDTISLQSLTKNVFYRVAAVDRRGNYSEFSEVLRVERPDIIPPSAPLMTEYRADEDHNYLAWRRSSSIDAFQQVVYRKAKGEDNWFSLDTLLLVDAEYRDYEAAAGQTYYYKLTTLDAAGLESEPSQTVSFRTRFQAQHPAVAFSWSSAEGGLLTWEYEQAANQPINRIILYRAENEAPLTTYAQLLNSATQHIDTQTDAGQTYHYALKFVYENGSRSPLTPGFRVQIPASR